MAGPCSIVASQEPTEFIDNDGIKKPFHVGRRGCATLFNKDTVEPDLQVNRSGHYQHTFVANSVGRRNRLSR